MVFHVAARALATHALSIFGDHSDVMAARQTGFAMLASNSVQEAQDFACISHLATLASRIPFLHFFDGFRTSHETNKIDLLEDEQIRALVDQDLILSHRARGLTPDRPVMRGTAQNPDVFFQSREAANPYYAAFPAILQGVMDAFASITGRAYRLYEYTGAADADRIVIAMGSGIETLEETAKALAKDGEKVGVLKVRMYRPFSVKDFASLIPPTVKSIAVLDRTKEPGATGEPLYQDVITALCESLASGDCPLKAMPRVIGGRYGLASKEFSPAMAKAVFDEMKKKTPRNHFTVGINDDVSFTSLPYDDDFFIEEEDTVRAVFYGLGSDGTVGANKNSIKIIGDETELNAQGYFIYDSKKSGSTTVSHLRFGPHPIRSPYLITKAGFVACHHFPLLERMDVLQGAQEGSIFLLNAPFKADEVWSKLPATVQERIIERKLRLYSIDAQKVAREAGMGNRINTIMQTCFFAMSGVLPERRSNRQIKHAIEKTYGKRGEAIVSKNMAAVDRALEFLNRIEYPAEVNGSKNGAFVINGSAPTFVQKVTARLIAGEGEMLPVSAFPIDGTYPTGTACHEKRNIAHDIPVWDPDLCIQCGKCVMVCPHAVIRGKLYTPAQLEAAPEGFKSTASKFPDHKQMRYTLQVAPEDCTGCSLCVEACPVKNKSQVGLKAINMRPQAPLREQEAANWEFFLGLPDMDRSKLDPTRVKDVQLLEPLFEFSGACAGCGETPYLKLLTQLFGDRALVANATGCSSIYGGNLPTTPWSKNREGRGPSWSNSLFEDNAEFGLGMRLSIDQKRAYATLLVEQISGYLGDESVLRILTADQSTEKAIKENRERIEDLKRRLLAVNSPLARDLESVADSLVRKSVWIIGGDGWAYDIGFGGLDHVFSSGRDVNILVLDTEVYSNTGGQQSKSTPRGAVAKFAVGGKLTAKKDLAMQAMSYGNCYVARVAFGANDAQTIKAFVEAESYRGPSLILAYSHCIAHGYDLQFGIAQQKAAVESGYWPLLRFDPRRTLEGSNPCQIDSKVPSLPLEKYIYNETRYGILPHTQPETAKELLALAKQDVRDRWKAYERLASGGLPPATSPPPSPKPTTGKQEVAS